MNHYGDHRYGALAEDNECPKRHQPPVAFGTLCEYPCYINMLTFKHMAADADFLVFGDEKGPEKAAGNPKLSAAHGMTKRKRPICHLRA